MALLTKLVVEHDKRGDLRFVAAGGDGTVSWVAELVTHACAIVGAKKVPPISILSLGTGNEMAHVTGWAGRYGGESLVSFVRNVAEGRVVEVDSWVWQAVPLELDDDDLLMQSGRTTSTGTGDCSNGGGAAADNVSPIGLSTHNRNKTGANGGRLRVTRRSFDFDGGGGFGHVPGWGFGSTVTLTTLVEPPLTPLVEPRAPLHDLQPAVLKCSQPVPIAMQLDADSSQSSDDEGKYDDHCRRDEHGAEDTLVAMSTGSEASADTVEVELVENFEVRRPSSPVAHPSKITVVEPMTPPKSPKRYSMETARLVSEESSDLPHLPEFAFAPPPMTPPGTQVCSPGKLRRLRIRESDNGIDGGANVDAAKDQGSAVRSEGRGAIGGSKGVSAGMHSMSRGPANNGIGFHRLCCRRANNRSSGGSMDFAADGFGFDDLDLDSDEEDDEVKVVTKTSVCFFSVGFDASIAMQFHQLRERTPCCADSVPKIVAGHTWLGIAELFSARKYLRTGVLTLRVDDREIPIPPGANTIQCFNIHSSATGIDFFGTGQRSLSGELQEYEPPNIGDGLVEVVATFGVGHLSAIRLGLGHSHRLAQGRVVEMVLQESLPVQVDGEPWLQPPAVIRLSLGGKIPFVLGPGKTLNVPPMQHVRKPSRNDSVDFVL